MLLLKFGGLSMFMKNFCCIVLLIFVIGCDQNTSTMKVESQTTADTTALSQELDVTNQQVLLLPQAREITDEWLAYITAQTEIENFDEYTVKEVISNATPIAEIFQNLRETVPTEFQTNAVQTRLSVLYTKAKVLEHLAGKRNPDPEAIKATAEEIPVEFNNFKIQLNELFLKTLEDFEEELDALEVEEDTIPGLNRRQPGSRGNNQ